MGFLKGVNRITLHNKSHIFLSCKKKKGATNFGDIKRFFRWITVVVITIIIYYKVFGNFLYVMSKKGHCNKLFF